MIYYSMLFKQIVHFTNKNSLLDHNSSSTTTICVPTQIIKMLECIMYYYSIQIILPVLNPNYNSIPIQA